jgi:hypothetical protein
VGKIYWLMRKCHQHHQSGLANTDARRGDTRRGKSALRPPSEYSKKENSDFILKLSKILHNEDSSGSFTTLGELYAVFDRPESHSDKFTQNLPNLEVLTGARVLKEVKDRKIKHLWGTGTHLSAFKLQNLQLFNNGPTPQKAPQVSKSNKKKSPQAKAKSPQ